MKNKFYKQEEGQIALIFLLISAIAMTLGLSVSRKESTETKIDVIEEKQKEAFNTAESGIEYYLGTGNASYQSNTGTETNKATVSLNDIRASSSLGEYKIDLGEYVLPSNPTFFWLVGHDNVGVINDDDYYRGSSLTICNNGVGVNTKIDYFYKGVMGEVKVEHIYSLFEMGCGKTVTIANNTTPLLLVLTPIEVGTKFSIKGTADFPSQGKEITSTGESGQVGDVAGNVKSRVRVTEKYEIPSFMLETLVAGIDVGY